MNKIANKHMTSILMLLLIFQNSCGNDKPETRILVFSKVAEFVHESIPDGINMLFELSKHNGWVMDTTTNSAYFSKNKLKEYSAVIFLNTTGDVLNQSQQSNFERYIQAGGGYVGIHSASDTEYDWPWYGKMVGGYFQSHPEIQEAEFYVTDRSIAATDSLPDRFTRTDEYYNFKSLNPEVNVIVEIDESTYVGGKNGDYHPMSWYHVYDGGRAFYTAMGHTKASYKENLFRNHVEGGIKWVIGSHTP